ncbi:MAG: choice-of-anchor D domain-containing protein [Terriglobales bacterium]
MRTITLTLLFCGVLMVIAAPAQTVILQENFDELTPTLSVTSAGVFTAVNGTNVDIVGAANGYANLCASPESGNCLDLDGSGGNSVGDIQSSPIALFPGIQYTLSFDLIGSGRGPETVTTVTFGPYYSHTFDLLSNDVTTGIVNFQFTVPSQTSAYLEFQSNTPNDNIGAVLDNVSITASPLQTLTLTLLDSGTGTVTDNLNQINCSEANGVVTGTCSTSYPSGTQVVLTASPNVPSPSTPASVFGSWGGACSGENSDGTTCTLIMISAQNASASFDIPGQSVQMTIPTASGSPPTVYSYNGGYVPDTGGYDYTAQGTNPNSNAPTFPAETTAIPTDLTTCNNTIAASFPGADCFVYQLGPTPDPTKDSPVMFELTCPTSPGEQCGSIALQDFLANLGSDFSFDVGENPPLNLVNSNPNMSPYGPLQAAGGNPYIGFLKGEGPDSAHPCTPFPPDDIRNNTMFTNQIISFTLADPGSRPVVANSGGTGSCWIVVYLTSDETPTVGITQPVPGGIYLQGQNDPTTKAAYTCTTVYNGVSTQTGGSYPAYGSTGPYLTGTCSATDSPGGSVGQGAQFDTATAGSHTFTATVLDSATNTASQTVTYTVQARPLLSVTPSSFNFGNVNFDLDLNPALITVKNIGAATASISKVSLTRGAGTNTVDFTLINLCPSTLAAGKTCYISALFFSGNLGPVSATVAITDNAPGSPQQVTLAANVVGFNPSSLNFGTVKVGHSSTQSVTLTNTGTTALTIANVTVSGANAHDFVKSSGCPSSLAATNSCVISITFTPSATGSRSAALSLSDNAALGTLIAPLSGKGN